MLLGVVIKALGNGPLGIDMWWHDLMLVWRTDVGLTVARALDAVGGVVSMIVIGIALVVGLVLARRPWDALVVLTAMVVSEAVATVLKLSLTRPRPADSLVTDAMTSFPSGHTTLAATVMVALALSMRVAVMWGAAAVWVTAMAWSRTYLAAHWLTDVFAGAVLGTSVALIAWTTMAVIRRGAQRTIENADRLSR
ncbi:phosphatase PAP2 family protein [Microbacterium terricola]|uniref:phosphatase PAP2 family protein n=1 Tax=Microbacterium terricola TaxID=344163 RepID=UPI0021E83148|nr:phosphatase PAP2 family protein [Microbacterium terricola]UYK40654.1 phosphatase PAP2 family protein [Microbacterium terricola]